MSPRVLVVDDDPHVLQLLRVNFELEGYDVLSALGGEEALGIIAADKPDVLVCDVMMPGMNGLEVVRRVRANPKSSKLPIVMVSAKTLPGDISAGNEAGVDAYVTKPFDPQDLLDAVARLLKRK
jgi:DNA-binding response OmpR family regulator